MHGTCISLAQHSFVLHVPFYYKHQQIDKHMASSRGYCYGKRALSI